MIGKVSKSLELILAYWSKRCHFEKIIGPFGFEGELWAMLRVGYLWLFWVMMDDYGWF